MRPASTLAVFPNLIVPQDHWQLSALAKAVPVCLKPPLLDEYSHTTIIRPSVPWHHDSGVWVCGLDVRLASLSCYSLSGLMLRFEGCT